MVGFAAYEWNDECYFADTHQKVHHERQRALASWSDGAANYLRINYFHQRVNSHYERIEM